MTKSRQEIADSVNNPLHHKVKQKRKLEAAPKPKPKLLHVRQISSKKLGEILKITREAQPWLKNGRLLTPEEVDLLTTSLPQILDTLKQMYAIMHFYADPYTYFALSIVPDKPAGPLMEDFSPVTRKWDNFGQLLNTPKPGKKAREFLDKFEK